MRDSLPELNHRRRGVGQISRHIRWIERLEADTVSWEQRRISSRDMREEILSWIICYNNDGGHLHGWIQVIWDKDCDIL